MGSTTTPPQLLTVKQLAAAMNISTSWIYKHSVAGCVDPIPYVGFGRAKRFDASAVRQHLESLNPARATLCGTEGIARVNGKAIRRMTRKRFQTGYVRLREDRGQPWWEGFYWLDQVGEEGSITRKRKSVKLGLESDLPTKRSAQRKLSEILSEINDTNYKPKSAISFRTFIGKYRENKLATLKDTTRHGYENNIRKHYLPFFGDYALAEIDTELVQAFINKKNKVEKKEYNTLHNLKFDLSSIFTAAVKWGYVKENPVTNVDLPPRGIEEPVKLPNADHLAVLIEALEEPFSTLVWFHAVTTVRPNEGFAFKFSDLNVETCQLTLSRGINRGLLHTPKYHRMNRPIQLTPDDVDHLLAYKQRMGLTDDDWIFPSKNRNAPLRHEDVLSRKIQPKAKELGLPHVTWRILRKWGSTHMIAARMPVKAVQDRLGHSRPDIVLRHYAQLLDESAKEAALVLSSKLSGGMEKLTKLNKTMTVQ
jgi:integrase